MAPWMCRCCCAPESACETCPDHVLIEKTGEEGTLYSAMQFVSKCEYDLTVEEISIKKVRYVDDMEVPRQKYVVKVSGY